MGTINTTINVGFDMDKNGYNKLMDSLQKVQNLTAKSMDGKKISKEFQEASKAAGDLKNILNNSWDSKLNQINLTKLNSELKKAQMSASDFYNKIAKGGQAGVAGADAFARSILNANTQLRQSNQLLDKMAVTFKNTVRYGISSSIFNTFTNSIQKAYNYTKNLDTSLNDIRIVSGQSAEQMAQFAISANRAAQALGKTTLDYTKAATIYYQQGLPADEIEARTQATLKAANVTGQSAQEVSEQLTAVWEGYNIPLEQTEEAVDKLAAVAAHSASDLEELSTGMSKVASAANLMGVDIDQLNAQMSTIISVTRQAPESVGTALRTIYARIADIKAGLDDETSLGNYSGKMAKLGINVLDASGELRKMGDVIEEVGSKWTQMSEEQRISLAQTMAGTRQYNNLLTLFNNWDKYQNALEISKNSAGELQKQQDIYMESTEAHLQQLQAEAEKTYNILFDQETVRGFADVAKTALGEFNGYLKGIGGGGSAILNLGAQIANLYRKQIGDSLVRSVENVKILIDETLNGGKQIENMKNAIKESRAQQLERQADIEEKPYLEEYAKATREHTDEQTEIVTQAWAARKGITNEQLKEIQNEAALLSQLKDEVAYNEALIKHGKTEYGVNTSEEAKHAVSQQENALKTSLDLKAKMVQLESKLLTLRGESEEKQRIENELQATAKEMVSKQVEQEALLDKENIQMATELAEKAQKEKLDQQDIENIKVTQNDLIREQNKNLKETQEIAEAIRQEEAGITDEKRNQINQTKKDVGDKLGDAKNRSSAASAVQIATATIQGLTAITGALGTLSDANSSAADKANAAWAGVFGTGSAIANALLPGSGFLVQGIGEVIKVSLKAAGVWEDIENTFKSSKELLEEINENAEKFSSEMKKQVNETKNVDENIKSLEEMRDRFTYLQNLAEKGLLTDDLRTEYESYLTKVQEYNKNIIISYDKQGNMITKNNNALDETIKKLKQQNDETKKFLYTGENWTNFEKQQNDDYNKKQEAWRKYGIENEKKLFDAVKHRASSSMAPVMDAPFVSSLESLGISVGTWERDIQNLDAWKENALATARDKDPDYYNYYKEEIEKYYKVLQKIAGEYEQKKAETIGALGIDSNFLINNLKSDPSQSTNYNKLAETIGESDLDNIYNGYLSGLDLSSEEFQEGGKFSIEKVRDSLRSFNASLLNLFTNAENGQQLQEFYKNIQDLKQKSGELTSQQYEERMRKAVSDFIKTLSKEQFEEYKGQLAAMFGLDSVSAMWNDEANTVTLGANGGNIVTSGEAKARQAAQIIAETNVGDKGDKKAFAENIEQYLQNSLSEVDLSKLDITKLSKDFNTLLYNAIDPNTGALREGLSMESVLQDAIDLQTNFESTPDRKAYNAVQNLGDVSKYDLDTDDLKGYTKHLMEMADASKELADGLKDDADAAAVVAKATMRMNNGIKDLADNWKDWKDILTKSSKSSEEYYEALDKTKEAAANLLDVDKESINSDFITNPERMKELEKAAKGDAAAINSLRDAYADDMLVRINVENGLDEDLKNKLSNDLNTLQGQLNSLEIGPIGDDKFKQACQDMIEAAGMTKEQAEKMFDAMGVDVKFEKDIKDVEQQVPRYVTKRNITKWENGQPVEWEESSYQDGVDTFTGKAESFAMATNGKTPKIESLTKKNTGGMNNYSSDNKGGGGPGKSKKSGSGAKSSKKGPNKDELDRYQLVNVQLKEISKELTKLDKQKNKLLGGNLVKNLNQQIKLLNDQIDVTEAKLKIAEKERAEKAKILSGYGAKFDAQGNVYNYETIFKQEQTRLNKVYDKYNKMSETQKKKYESTVKSAEERFKKFNDTISRYNTLNGDFIPGLEQDIIDAQDKITEDLIEEFNMEIKVRLDLADAKKEWNEFTRKYLKGWKENDVDKWASGVIDDLSLLINGNEEEGFGGTLIEATNQLSKFQAEFEKITSENKAGDWYRDNAAQFKEDWKDAIETAQEEYKRLQEAQDEMNEYFLQAMDLTQEKFDEQLDNFEAINKQIEHNLSLIDLLYGEDSYDKIEEQQKASRDNSLEQLAYLKQQKDYYDSLLATLNEEDEAWQEAKDGAQAANEALMEGLTNALEKAKEAFESGVAAVIKDMTDTLTNGKGFDLINKQWELMNENSELELDNINRMQGLQDIAKKYNDAINNTSNAKAQKELAEIRDKELEQLKEIDHLSQEDLERAEKKLEIAKAQIALEDAQQNKTQMRLRRDSQGNYRYQFVANEDQVNQARDQLAAAYNSLYNFDKERALQNNQEMISTTQQYFEEIANLRIRYGDDEEKYKEEKRILDEQYNEKMAILEEHRLLNEKNLNESTFADLNNLYAQNANNYELMTDAQKAALNSFEAANQTAFDLIFGLETENTEAFRNMADEEKRVIEEELIPQWNSGVDEMINKLADEGGFEQVATEIWNDITEKIKDYFEAIEAAEETSGRTFDELLGSENNIINQNKEWIESNKDLIQTFIDMTGSVEEFYNELSKIIESYGDIIEKSGDVIKTNQDLYDQFTTKEADSIRDTLGTEPTTGGTGAFNQPVETTPTTTTKTTSTKPSIPFDGTLPKGTQLYNASGGKYNKTQAARTVTVTAAVGSRYQVWGSTFNPHTVYIDKNAIKYDTGGYTGEWGNGGRLALLHQKELVLNRKDTANMLNAVEVLRGITDNIGADLLGRMANITAGGFSSAVGGNALEQNVHIEATFPGVKSSIEIQDALNNLVNMAAQRAQTR